MKNVWFYFYIFAVITSAACIFAGDGIDAINVTGNNKTELLLDAADKIPYLTDDTYEPTMRQTKGLAYVLFVRGGKFVPDDTLLNDAGTQTNRLAFFKVNLEKNPKLHARLEDGELLGADQSLNKDVTRLLLFDGVALKRQGDESVDREICSWMHSKLNDMRFEFENRDSSDHESAKPKPETTLQNMNKVSFLIEALEQLNIPKPHGEERSLLLWDALLNFKPASAIKPTAPALTKLLAGKYRVKARRVLAYMGEQSDLVVEQLIKELDDLSRKPIHRIWSFEESPEFVTIQEVGAIGKAATNAVPTLKKLAEQYYGKALSSLAEMGEGNSSLLGLVAAAALNQITPVEMQPAKKGAVTGKAVIVKTGRENGFIEITGAAIYFWNNDKLYQTVSENNGVYRIELPAGEYLAMSWGENTNFFQSKKQSHRIPDGPRYPFVIKVAEEKSTKKDIVADVMFVD